LADQNFRVKRGLEVGIGGTVLIAKSDGNIGIGSAIPTTKLDVDGTVTATSFAGDGSNLTGVSAINTELSGDTTPQLGGDLDLNSNDITGTGNVNITGVITATSFDGNLATTDLTGTITNAQLAGSIANDKLSNSSVSFGGVSVSLGAADATPAFDLQDATGYPTSSLEGTITNDQLAGSIADGKLASTFLKNVVEDTTPQLGGTLDTNGNLIQFGDSDNATDDRLQFGASQDLQIYHKTDSYIRDTGAGSLILTGSRIILKNPANDERMIDASENGSVKLLHNNLEKLETTGIGVSIVNGTETTATIAGPANLVLDPAAVGDNTGTVRIKGDLFVDGTTTQINSTTLELADFVVGVATTATTDLLTDGAGIGIGSDKTFLYEHNSGTNPSLKSSENLNVASGKGYQINQTEVLNATTLGSNVVSSSLTSVGTLSALTVGGSIISNYGEIKRNADNSNFAITGGTASNSGGNLVIYGANHSSLQNVVRIRQGSTDRIYITSDGKIGVNNTSPLSDLHVCTAGSSEQDGTFRIGGDGSGVGLVLDYDQSGSTLSRIMANDSYTNSSALLKISVDGDLNTNQLVLKGDGKIGVNNNDPLYSLHIKNAMGSSPSYIHMEVTGTNTIGGGGGIAFDTSASNSDSSNSLYLATIAGVRNSDDDGSNDLVFSTTTANVNGNLPVEKLRITSSGILLKSGQAALTSTSLSHSVQVAASSEANAIAIIGRAADDIGELSFYEADKSTKLGELQYRQDHLNFRHRVGYISFATGGTTERIQIQSNGQILFKGTSGDNQFTSRRTNVASSAGDYFFHLNAQNSDSTTVGSLGFHRDTATDDSRFVISTKNTGGSFTERLRIKSDGTVDVGSSTNDQLILNPGSGSLDSDASKLTIQGRTNDGTAVAFEIKRQASANSGDASTHKLKIDYAGNFGIGSDFVPAGANGATLGAINKGAIIKGGDAAVGVRLESTAGSGGILEAFAEDGGVSFDTRGSGFIRVKSASTESLRIDSDGRVFIGTARPSSGQGIFNVKPSSGDEYLKIRDAGDFNDNLNGIAIDNRNAANTASKDLVIRSQTLVLWQNNTEKLRITSDGKVGIDNSNPTRSLSVSGSINIQSGERIESYSSSGSLIVQGGSTYPGGHLKLYGGSGDDKIEFCTSGSSASSLVKMTLKGDGKLGIGTDNPSRNLSVYDASNAGVEIKSGTTGQSSVFFTDTADGNIGMIGYYHSDNSMFFRTNDAEAVRITSGGNVGINTTTPANRLFVEEPTGTNATRTLVTFRKNHTTTTVSGNIAKDSFPHALMLENSDNSSDTGLASLGFTKFTSGAQSQAAIVGESTSAGTMDLTFHTESSNTIAEKVRIAHDGKVTMTSATNDQRGLSVIAPKTQINFGTAADVGGFLMSENNGQFGLSGGAYWNGSDWTATHTGSAQIRHDGSGAMVFATNASLTGGNTFTPTQRFCITSDGKLLIGGHSSGNYSVELINSGQQTILIGSSNSQGAMLILDGDSNGDGAGTDYASIVHSTAGNIEINNRKSADILFKTTSSETEKLRITSDGKVGIGSISPAQLLDIASTAPNIRFTDTADGHSEIDGNAAELKFNADKGNTKADSKITFFVDNDEKVRITSDGKIGINESSPDATLEINSGSTATALDIRGSAGQLFSVTNSLSSGSIFSVNDISGVPSIDVDADGTIQLAPFGGTVELYYNGTKRFETNSVGVIITGLIGLGGANNYGTSGQVLTSNGSQLSPTWQDAASGGGGGEFSLSGTGKAIHSSAAGNSSSASHSFFVGTNAGNNNITGGCNNLIGCRAGCSLTSGRDNNFFGDSSGTDTTTGEFNNFMGAAAGRYNTTGCHNNFFGANAGKSDAFAAGTGCHNNFFGCDAGRFITTGKFNNYIGISAGCSGDNGCCNNFIGRSAGKGAAGNNNNFFGSYAGCRNSGSHNNFIGEKAGKLNCDAGFNNYIGRYAGCGNITGSFNNYIGRYAGCAFCCGSNNNFIGHGAGRSTTSQGNGQGTGSNNNFFGCDAGFKTTSGCHNNFFGMNAGRNNTTGSNNVFIGCSAGCRNTTASHNVFVGQGTGGFVCTNACNTAVGRWSGYYLSGARNTFLGARSGKQFTSGSDNVSIGYYAGGSPGGGYYSFQTGSYNITIGSLSCTSNTTVSNEVSIFNNCKTARFQGNATAWSFVSDEREKKNIIDLPLGGDFLSKLRPRKFEWKSEDEDSHEQASGFVAQEVLEVVEEYNAHYTGLVDTNDPNQYTFAAAALIPMIVNAIQELRQELEQVKSRIDTLESS
jgi:hypothetical protein